MKIDIRMYNLPVLPPELRPIVYRSGDKVVTSDINELYKRGFLSFWHRAILPRDLPYSIVTAVEFNHQIRRLNPHLQEVVKKEEASWC